MQSLEERQREMRSRMLSREVRAKWSQPAIARAIAPINPQSGLVSQGLSPRQVQLLQLLAAGHNLKQAAAQLKIGHQTAKNYSRFIRASLGASTIAQAVMLGMRKQIIQ